MKRSDFRFRDALRVRWAEVDMQKVVFNGHYLMYVDTAMGNFWRALALPYEATLQALDGDLFVRKSTLEYLAPARYDDALEVGIRLAATGTSSLRFVAGVFLGEELLVHGEIVYVWVDAATRRPQPVPVEHAHVRHGGPRRSPVRAAHGFSSGCSRARPLRWPVTRSRSISAGTFARQAMC